MENGSFAHSQNTFSLRFSGLVQGIGFRPFVYQIAIQQQLKGQVSNDTDGVCVLLTTNEENALKFLKRLIDSPPTLAKITKYSIEKIAYQYFESFNIVESPTAHSGSRLMLTPDFSLCANCRQELHNTINRRYRYPFITCTQCGPRYSIQRILPYDRPTTTMQAFKMCPACEREYNHPADRRFYSQTNSCPECGVQLRLFKSDGKVVHTMGQLNDSQWILARISWELKQGKIIAVKGIGGYLLLCDATNEATVLTLRKRKHRPSKPLAVLYPTLERLREDAYISTQEAEALQSVVAPIVLVRSKKSERFSTFWKFGEAVNPNLNHLGVMLPYSPLLELIAKDFGKPLVATSGNFSGSPIIFKDDQAQSELGQVADFILTDNHEIVVPQDDSVIRFSEKYGQKIVIRRSRGLAPNGPLSHKNTEITPTSKNETTLAFGASLKSTFGLKTIDNLYLSQYLGDLEDFETQENFKHTLNHFLQLFQAKPTQLLTDAHKGYFSTQLAQELGKSESIPVIKTQHHAAHFAAVLAENELLETTETVLGVIWDGTGYGTDGQIWGGEYLLFNPPLYQTEGLSFLSKSMARVNHFEYFDAFLGDKMPREPRLSAFSLLKEFPEYWGLVSQKFNEKEWDLYTRLLQKNTLKTSSVGRIFDGVASLLGLLDKNHYEGEAALRLEELAGYYFNSHGYSFAEHYFQNRPFPKTIPTHELIKGVVQDILKDKPKDWIAAKFHFSLIKAVEIMANELNTKKIAFSGGVFQNAVLVDLMIENMGKTHELFFHQELPPNDECIAFGQLMLVENRKRVEHREVVFENYI
ncbi:carbamoyltransferase HypF [Runella aurantiaca]|uniref:Carbamoyltransferase n=1 Tax=Runella aurantiaca TaxID=2282308 RepID=A0A369I9C9_9BACT|nr:carbamoyltransferase HypF [Runella aurantiaca]RDB06371.1 carbamoyltransferase HypF [Runella aurantiaca]